MKRSIWLLFASSCLWLAGCSEPAGGTGTGDDNGNPGGSLEEEYVEISDPLFSAFLVKQFDKDKDGRISKAEAEKVTAIRVTENWEIASVEGIASFPNLIAGFCGETAEDHAQTLSLMREVGYDSAYMFKYSQRPGTLASRTMTDDVSEEVKTARLNEIIALQNELSTASNERDMGNVFEVLVEGLSRRSSEQLCGRTSQNKMVVFDRTGETAPGDYVRVRITGCTSATLFGVAE